MSTWGRYVVKKGQNHVVIECPLSPTTTPVNATSRASKIKHLFLLLSMKAKLWYELRFRPKMNSYLFFYFFIKFLFAINIRSNAVVRTIGPAIAVRKSAVGIISISIWKSIVTSIPVASIPVVSSVKFLDIFGFYTIFLTGTCRKDFISSLFKTPDQTINREWEFEFSVICVDYSTRINIQIGRFNSQ